MRNHVLPFSLLIGEDEIPVATRPTSSSSPISALISCFRVTIFCPTASFLHGSLVFMSRSLSRQLWNPLLLPFSPPPVRSIPSLSRSRREFSCLKPADLEDVRFSQSWICHAHNQAALLPSHCNSCRHRRPSPFFPFISPVFPFPTQCFFLTVSYFVLQALPGSFNGRYFFIRRSGALLTLLFLFVDFSPFLSTSPFGSPFSFFGCRPSLLQVLP